MDNKVEMMDGSIDPKELGKLPNWVCYKRKFDLITGKYKKIPINPRTGKWAKINEPETWTVGHEAKEAMIKNKYLGIGFVFTKNIGIVAVDIDNCRDTVTGELNDLAKEVINTLNSYTEISISGTGIHILAKGTIPKGSRNSKTEVEMYCEGRFFVMTGKTLDGTPNTINERSLEIMDIFKKYIEKKPLPKSSSTKPKNPNNGTNYITPTVTLTDDEIIDKAMNAKNGAKFKALWEGNYTELYGSQSEADLALCGILAFWTNKDVTGIDRLIRKSGLFRQKWDEVHSGEGKTYGEGLIEKVVSECNNVYTPPSPKKLKQPAVPNHSEGEIINAVDLMNKQFTEKKWIVKDLIHQGLILLCGKPKMGKSWMALTLGIVVSGGGDFLGKFETKETGEVLYLALEDTQIRLQDRMNTLMKGSQLSSNLSFVTKYPSGYAGIIKLDKWLSEHPNARLVIIDTLAKIRGLGGEKGTLYAEDYDAISEIKNLADKYNTAIVVVHHLRKMGSSDPVDEVSGSTGLTGAADAILILKRERSKDEGTLFSTGRDSQDKEMALKFDLDNMGWKYTGEAEEHKVSNERQEILDVLKESDYPMTPKELATELGKNNNTVRGLISKLFKEGLIQKNSVGRYSICINSVNAVNGSTQTTYNTGLQSVWGKNDTVNSTNNVVDLVDYFSQNTDKNKYDYLLGEDDCDNNIITDKEKSPNKEDCNIITEVKDNIKTIIEDCNINTVIKDDINKEIDNCVYSTINTVIDTDIEDNNINLEDFMNDCDDSDNDSIITETFQNNTSTELSPEYECSCGLESCFHCLWDAK